MAHSSFEEGADVRLALRADLERRGGQRAVWGVLREDTYETVFGDGYYAYLEAAFATEEEAVTFAANNKEGSTIWHIRKYELHLLNEEASVVTPSKLVERHPWTPGTRSFLPTAEQEPINVNMLLDCWASGWP